MSPSHKRMPQKRSARNGMQPIRNGMSQPVLTLRLLQDGNLKLQARNYPSQLTVNPKRGLHFPNIAHLSKMKLVVRLPIQQVKTLWLITAMNHPGNKASLRKISGAYSHKKQERLTNFEQPRPAKSCQTKQKCQWQMSSPKQA
jgi:hypothetical protein